MIASQIKSRTTSNDAYTNSAHYDGIPGTQYLISHMTASASQIKSRTTSNDAYANTAHYDVQRSYAVNGLNQYTSAGPAAFLYDPNGNLTSDGSVTFTYDVENRLVQASGARNAVLTYDPLGRLWEVSNGTNAGIQRLLYDGDALAAEYDDSGAITERYAHDNGADQPLVWYEGGTVDTTSRRHLFANWQGSITAITKNDGSLVAINAYDAYGIPNDTNIGRFQYTGQIWIAELGLYHYKARVYSPTLGRFLQTDPIGYEDEWNLYAYVGNDPVTFVDPTGEGREAGAAVADAMEFVNYRSRMSGAKNPSQREQIAKAARSNFRAKGLGLYEIEADRASQESTRRLQRLYSKGKTPSEKQLKKFAKAQGWKKSQTENGPVKYKDKNGTARLTIKQGSERADGSKGPHVEYRDVHGDRRDPVTGKRAVRKSGANHRPYRRSRRRR